MILLADVYAYEYATKGNWLYFFYISVVVFLCCSTYSLEISLIVDVFATQAKFIQYNVINFAFTFRTTYSFSWFCDVMAYFKRIKHKFSNYVYLCRFPITYGVKQCSTCQHTNYHNTTNLSGYPQGFKLPHSRNIRAITDHVQPKYSKTFDSP